MPPRAVCLGKQDENCTARYHGTESAYQKGCRCPHARENHRLYNKRRREGRNPPGYVNATGTRRRMMALAAIGWPFAVQTQLIGWNATPGKLMWGSSRVTPRVARQVADLYERLKDTPGPSRITRARAASKGWPTPAEWDIGGDIDDIAADARPAVEDAPDPVAIDRALHGHRVPLTPLERQYAVHLGHAKGMAASEVASHLRMSYSVTKSLLKKPLPGGYQLAA